MDVELQVNNSAAADARFLTDRTVTLGPGEKVKLVVREGSAAS